MAKKSSPLDIMNKMAGAAHQKAQPQEPDEDDMAPPKPNAKMPPMAKKKVSAKAPKLPKLA